MDICDALTNANARKVIHRPLPLADTPSKTYGKRLMQIPWQWFRSVEELCRLPQTHYTRPRNGKASQSYWRQAKSRRPTIESAPLYEVFSFVSSRRPQILEKE